MSKIAEFLTKFDDQHLANLQCAAEDGTLVYHNYNACLVHHFRGDYSVTKWESEYAELARDAERDYRDLGQNDVTPFTEEVEIGRRKALLPLIHAEWARRTWAKHNPFKLVADEWARRGKLPQEINNVEEFAQVSPSIR